MPPRAFEQFALTELPQRVHAALIKTHLGGQIVGHVSRDSTAINAREAVSDNKREPSGQPANPWQPSIPGRSSARLAQTEQTEKPEQTEPEKRERGRPRKGQQPAAVAPKRLEVQGQRTLEENIADLPTQCDVGTKRNSKGYKETWRGSKLHLAANDLDIPLCGLLSSASLHDSQAAIPVLQICSQVVEHSFYDLFDAAYDSPHIAQFSRWFNHVPIMDPNPRNSANPRQLAPHQQQRLKERSSVERVNSNLKDNWGGRFVRVRGAAKVACHLFFGILAMTANRLLEIIRQAVADAPAAACQN